MNKPKNKDNYKHLDDLNCCSVNECTGLITVPPETDEELESYMEIYDFGPPICKSNNP